MVLPILVCFLNTGVALAEKQEWVDKTYDFSKVKRIVIFDPNILDKLKNGINEKEIIEIFKSKAKIEKVIIIELSKICNNIYLDTGINLVELNQQNPSEALRILDESLPKYADIYVASSVNEYSMGSQYNEGYTYNTTSYQTSYVTGPGGTATIQTPVNQTHTIPGGYVSVAYANVRFEVYDIKTNKAIFTRIDNRQRSNDTIFEHGKPKDLYGRITKSFFDDLSKKINKE